MLELELELELPELELEVSAVVPEAGVEVLPVPASAVAEVPVAPVVPEFACEAAAPRAATPALLAEPVLLPKFKLKVLELCADPWVLPA
jgi:hypothetical protein